MSNAMQRILRLQEGAGHLDVTVNIHWPEPRENSWFADWSIGWPGRERKGSAGGEDAIQAMLAALKLVGSELYCSAEHEAGDWTGPTGGQAMAFRCRTSSAIC